MSEGRRAFIIRRFDHLGARAPRLPVADFPQSHGGALAVALFVGSPMRRFEAGESGLDVGKSRFGHEIAVRRYKPVRKPDRVVVCFLDERAAHCGLPGAELRFDLSASILFDASALVRLESKVSGSLTSSDSVFR